MTHLSSEMLELFVLGALDPGQVDAVGRHVGVCAECASRLEREAQLELAFHWAALARRQRHRRASRAWGAGLSLAAAAMVAWLSLRPDVTQLTVEGAVVTAQGLTCPDGPQQPDCIERAHRRGLLVSYPVSAGFPSLDGRARTGLPRRSTRFGVEVPW